MGVTKSDFALSRRAFLLSVAAAALSACSGLRDTGARSVGEIVPPASRGTPLSLQGPRLGGGEVNSSDWLGAPVVVNIWGSWCAPCRSEAAALQAVAAATSSAGVHFLGVNVQDNDASALAYERRYAISYPSISDPSEQVLLQLVAERRYPRQQPTSSMPGGALRSSSLAR